MKKTLLCLIIASRCSGVFAGAAFPEVRVIPSNPHGPLFVVNGRELPAAIYYANNQYQRDDLALEGMHKAYDAGFRVLSVQLLLPGTATSNEIFQTLEKFMDPFPDALILPRVWMGVSSEWYKENPDQLYTFSGGQTVADIASPVSEKWLQEANRRMGELLDLMAGSKYAKRFIGVIPLYYYTGEWHMWELDKSGGYSPLMETAFQTWLAQNYSSVEKLNDAWHADYRRFDEIRLPTKDERYKGTFGLFRDPSQQQREIDFALFFNTRSPELMLSIARTIKEKTEGRTLVGYFYGYLFEHAWNDVWPQQGGHLGLSKLLASPDVDFYGCSYSYNMFNRSFGLPADFISPHDSARLNGKAVFFEEDSYTHLAIPPEMDWAPGWPQRTVNLKQTMAVLKRNMGLAMAHGEMMHWQDLLSDGRFNDDGMWDWYCKASAFRHTLRLGNAYRPQVAVVIDETYPIWQQVSARPVFGRWVYETRMMLSRVDVTCGYYLQNDLDKIPDSVRCVLLLTPYRITPEQKIALQTKFMKGGRMVVFCYLPDMFKADRPPELSGFCGMGLKLQRKSINPEARLVPDTLLPGKYENVLGDNRDLSFITTCPGTVLADVNPYLTVSDSNAVVFANYTATGEASCAWKAMDDWTSVYLGTSRLSVDVWRALFKKAGCHLYLEPVSDEFDAPDFIQASGNFLMVQSFNGGKKIIRLPAVAASVYVWRDGTSSLIVTNAASVELNLEPGIPEYIYWEGTP